ncbi:MAG TPA: hypothetical protein VFL96_09840 [Acidobacteriaceae bacterium]|nr:hypothetical protein [Acidobacteriaceae bacterium]
MESAVFGRHHEIITAGINQRILDRLEHIAHVAVLVRERISRYHVLSTPTSADNSGKCGPQHDGRDPLNSVVIRVMPVRNHSC